VLFFWVAALSFVTSLNTNMRYEENKKLRADHAALQKAHYCLINHLQLKERHFKDLYTFENTNPDWTRPKMSEEKDKSGKCYLYDIYFERGSEQTKMVANVSNFNVALECAYINLKGRKITGITKRKE
tara:strand:+ start:10619 stop:11002 length:384 start_codon:yes stop_codon:yes gene_type:complete